jgi:uncharacterized protein (TIGR00297 family)
MLISPQISTVVLALAASAGIAFGARRAKSLSTSGAMAATAGGTVSMVAGWYWGVFLVVWFLYASLLSRAGHRHKAERTRGMIAKGGRRDAWQVLANGGVYFLLALTSLVMPDWAVAASIMAAAALTAAGADTTATEIGTWWRGSPISLRSWSRVPPGTSGAVSVVGSLAMVVSAILLSGVAVAIGLIPAGALWLTTVAGVAGAVSDTLLGAAAQSRRRCDACAEATEQTVHRCGTPTRPDGGLAWMTNDVVNLLCTVTAAAVAGAWLYLVPLG